MSNRIIDTRSGTKKKPASRLVIVPDLGSFMFGSSLNWLGVSVDRLMEWTDHTQASGKEWHGLAIVAPDLASQQLYQKKSTFEEAWTWWASDNSDPERQLRIIIRDEFSGNEFVFGHKTPHITIRVSVFGREFFEAHCDPSSTNSQLVIWKKILQTMMPGCNAYLTSEEVIEQWLDNGNITLPRSRLHRNPRRYTQVLVLRQGSVVLEHPCYRLPVTSYSTAPQD